MLDDAVHLSDLRFERGGNRRRYSRLADCAAHHRERRFQAVGEIAERVAETLLLRAFVTEQCVHAAGQPLQFGRVGADDALAVPCLHTLDLAPDLAQRPQPPAQCDSEHRDEQQRHAAEPRGEARAKMVDLAHELREVLGDAERVRPR